MSTALISYLLLLAAVIVQRLLELRRADRSTKMLLCLGAEEVAPGHYTAMRLLHGAWLVCCIVEAVWREVPPSPWLSAVGLIALVIGQVLRIAAMQALGPRWTTRILVLSGLPPITGGIYRWVRHPNYLGVILELAALPLIYGGIWTALFFTVANLVLLLGVRIPAEEAALVRVNDYAAYQDDQNRFIPNRSDR